MRTTVLSVLSVMLACACGGASTVGGTTPPPDTPVELPLGSAADARALMDEHPVGSLEYARGERYLLRASGDATGTPASRIEALAALPAWTEGAEPRLPAARAALGLLGEASDAERNRTYITAIRLLEHEPATDAPDDVLADVFRDATQHILLRRLALEVLGRRMNDGNRARVVELAVEGLYAFDEDMPQMRMNDVAARVLIGGGEEAQEMLGFLVDETDPEVLRARAPRVWAHSEAYVEAVLNLDASIDIDGATVRQAEAAYALGNIGDPSSARVLLPLTQAADAPWLQSAGMLALLRLRPIPDEAITRLVELVREQAPRGGSQIAQLLAAAGHTHDGRVLPSLEAIMADDDVQEPVVYEAALQHARMAFADEAARAPVPEVVRDPIDFDRLAELGRQCDRDPACWRGHLANTDAENTNAFDKAASMLIRLRNQPVLEDDALWAALRSPNVHVRLAAVEVFDHLALQPATSLVERFASVVEALRAEEEGQARWSASSHAMNDTLARLRARAGR